MAGEGVYGVLTAGGVEVAIPAAALQEVIAWPASIVPQLLAPSFMLGLFDLRGMPLPACDLRLLTAPGRIEARHTEVREAEAGLAGAGKRAAKMAIVATAQGRLGLAVDDIADVVRAGPEALRRLGSPAGRMAGGTGGGTAGDTGRVGAPLVSTLLTLEGGGRIVQLLDLDALIAQPGMVTLAGGQEEACARRGNGTMRQYLFFECDDLRFCLEAVAVREVVEGATIDRSMMLGGLHQGMATLRGRPVPVLDLFNVLALPGGEGPKPRLLVLDVRGQTVAILVSALIGIHRLSPEHVMPLPAYGLKRPEFFNGVVAAEATGKDTLMLSEDAILLSHEAFLRDKDVAALHRLHAGLGQAKEEAARRPGGVRTAWLGCAAGEPLSVPLAQVDEILRMPANLLRLPSADGTMLGFMKRRGAMLPLIDLRRLAGYPARPVDGYTRILLVRGPRTRFAFMVDNTVAVRHVFVRRRMDEATGSAAGGMLREATSLYLVEDAEGEHARPLLDLAALAARLEEMPQAA